MALPDILLSVSLLSIGAAVIGTGLRCLDRRDRLRAEAAKQNGCPWHHWQASEDAIWLTCGLCGKRSRKLNPHHDPGLGTPPPENIIL